MVESRTGQTQRIKRVQLQPVPLKAVRFEAVPFKPVRLEPVCFDPVRFEAVNVEPIGSWPRGGLDSHVPIVATDLRAATVAERLGPLETGGIAW